MELTETVSYRIFFMKWFSLVIAAVVLCFSFHLPICASESEWQTVIGIGDVGGMDMSKPSKKFKTEDTSKGVGIVVVAVPGHAPIPVGTAWLYKTDVLATNAHVALGVKKTLQKLATMKLSSVPYYLPNRSKGKSVQIIDFSTHPDYKNIPVNMNGKRPVTTPDVALMRLKEKLSSPLSVAGKDALENLKPGDAIQYIGFPIENLMGDNVNLNNVLATTKSGTINAVSNWWLGDSGPEANKLIRHDLGATGGASGSPIFNRNGQVIGLVNAGNIIKVIEFKKSGKPTIARSPSAVMINFGIRVDLLKGVSLK